MIEPTPQMVKAFREAFESTPPGDPGERFLAGLRASLNLPHDDPSKDLVGTVRSVDGDVTIRLRDGHFPWLQLRLGGVGWEEAWLGNNRVSGHPIIGAVPGTPAAAAQEAATQPPPVEPVKTTPVVPK